MKKSELYELLNSFKSKGEIYKHFGMSGNSQSIKKINELAKSVNFDLNVYSKRRKGEQKFCSVCGDPLKNRNYTFCSHSCSAKHTNKNRIISEETRKKIKNSLIKRNYKPVEIKLCKICGEEKCSNMEICKHSKSWFENLICFDFKIDVLGTKELHKEYYRIKEIILKEYFEDNLSPKEIGEKYGYNKNFENILHILKSFGIKTRNTSESQTNSCLNSKKVTVFNDKTKYQFKHGWHNTWYGDKTYYRSGYELEYAEILDKDKIFYQTEFIRILYWDSIKKRHRVAIPDFFLKDYNKIIEIKSRATFNKQNVLDKFDEYIKIGYSVLLIFEHKEYEYDDIINIEESKFMFPSMK